MTRVLVAAGLLVFSVAGVTGLASVAHAQVISEQAPPVFPDPKHFARGFYAQGELGALVYVGRAGKFAGPGPAFSVRLGYDILRWLSIQAHVLGSSGQVNIPGPTDGQSFQTLVYGGELHGQVQIRRVGLYAEAGAAAAHIPSNVLDDAGITGGHKISLAVVAGGGLDFHTLNRHFSFGVGADYLWLASFSKSSAVTAQAFLKYTR
ncbi:MAG: adventurous gliding motility protein CglE [Polyangia bacterium]